MYGKKPKERRETFEQIYITAAAPLARRNHETSEQAGEIARTHINHARAAAASPARLPVGFTTTRAPFLLHARNAPALTLTLRPILPLRLRDLLVEGLEVVRRQVMYAHIPLLAAGGVGAAVRREGKGVDGAEVAVDRTELVVEHVVEKGAVEVALLRRRRGDTHRVLPACRDEVGARRKRRHSRRVDVALGVEGLE